MNVQNDQNDAMRLRYSLHLNIFTVLKLNYLHVTSVIHYILYTKQASHNRNFIMYWEDKSDYNSALLKTTYMRIEKSSYSFITDKLHNIRYHGCSYLFHINVLVVCM